MTYSALKGADFAAPVTTNNFRIKDLPALPRGARPAPRPARPSFMNRRYEIQWLNDDGLVDFASRSAPALPEFEEAFCALARGTLVETTNGTVAIEDLEPGMVVVTAEGREERIIWIGSMTMFPPNTISGVAPASLTRITADAFYSGRPLTDLLLGEQARVLVRGARAQSAGHKEAYVPARSLIDGDTIIKVTPIAPMAMYHVVLEQQGSLVCAGMEIESYHPGRNISERLDPQLAQALLSLFPTMKTFCQFGPLAHPRLSQNEAESMMAA